MTDFKEEFHTYIYEQHRTSTWLGRYVNKCPTDLWKLQETIARIRPDVFIECGTEYGGSAAYIADLFKILGHGKIITIDIRRTADQDKRADIVYLEGSSVDRAVLEEVERLISPGDVVMVDLDSDHRKAHVLMEMDAYARFVTNNSYLIVEDGNINGHPVMVGWGEGPFEALREWLPKHPEFKNDDDLEAKYGMTCFPGGWLRRVI